MSLESAQETIFDTQHAAQPYSADPLSALTVAKAQAKEAGLPYSGTVPPTIAWSLFRQGSLVLVDVRTTEERHFVGHVPGSTHVAWATGTSLNRNPRFLKELETRAGDKDATILLLCRSGNRSAAAATAAFAAGFQHVFNIAEGFEGDLDQNAQRGRIGGWRFHGLPWAQD